MATPTDEEMRYGDVIRWVNWAVQNDQASGTMGQILETALSRMGLPKPLPDMHGKLLLATPRMVMNGPRFLDKGPEPKPYKKKPVKPQKVELKVKDYRVLITPPPVEWN